MGISNKPVRIENFGSQYMHLDGAPSTINMKVTGSLGTPVDFVFEPAVGEVFLVSRLIMFGFGSSVVTDTAYVSLSALTNGCLLTLNNSGGVAKDITDGLPIKDNNGWNDLCYDARQNLYSANPKSLNARYTLTRDTNGLPIVISGDAGEKIVYSIRDDLDVAGMILHHIRVGCYQIQ